MLRRLMERRFHCTVCGKCCYGKLPLTLNDAIANAGRFPLAMFWTAVRQGAKSFEITARLGATATLLNRKKIALQITPVAYLPPLFPCPALSPDGRCAIHADRPLRCRAMPFYPFREESDQVDMLVPRKGWDCDTSANAPVVYRDRKVVHRGDFDRERQGLIDQASIVRAYADSLMANAPNVAMAVEKAARKRHGGHVVLNFTGILPKLSNIDAPSFARKQLPVLSGYADRTAGTSELKEFHEYYGNCATGMKRLLERR
ncbi:MAG: YkgJ family cysteine cluster protein [Rhodospirillales bacterium]